jgi:hypothetical protein
MTICFAWKIEVTSAAVEGLGDLLSGDPVGDPGLWDEDEGIHENDEEARPLPWDLMRANAGPWESRRLVLERTR